MTIKLTLKENNTTYQPPGPPDQQDLIKSHDYSSQKFTDAADTNT